jgi:hypothetical protein
MICFRVRFVEPEMNIKRFWWRSPPSVMHVSALFAQFTEIRFIQYRRKGPEVGVTGFTYTDKSCKERRSAAVKQELSKSLPSVNTKDAPMAKEGGE